MINTITAWNLLRLDSHCCLKKDVMFKNESVNPCATQIFLMLSWWRSSQIRVTMMTLSSGGLCVHSCAVQILGGINAHSVITSLRHTKTTSMTETGQNESRERFVWGGFRHSVCGGGESHGKIWGGYQMSSCLGSLASQPLVRRCTPSPVRWWRSSAKLPITRSDRRSSLLLSFSNVIFFLGTLYGGQKMPKYKMYMNK